jgi:hypothetical protein
MSTSGLVTVLGVAAALFAAAGSFLGYLYSRARNARDDLRAAAKAEALDRVAAETAHSLAESAQAAASAVSAEVRGLRSEVTAQDSRVTILESKMDVFWRNVAFDVSKILHSPHPGWESLDALLEKFQGAEISATEMADLETQLRDMVEGRWEPAEVTRADQVAASLLLRAIEQTRV